MNFKPMLAADASGVDLKTLRYPLLISPKLDGIRCIIWEGKAYSRNAKLFPNRMLQAWASDHHNLDGEIIAGSPTDPNCLGASQSFTKSVDLEADFNYHLFDSPGGVSDYFANRLEHVQDNLRDCDRIECVPHYQVVDAEALLGHELEFLKEGYEGAMLRDPSGRYKHGRSTMNEGWLMKLKRFTDGEARVVGIQEGRTNNNVAFRDELGRTKRQTLAENMVGNGMVGTLICKDAKWGDIRVAPGKMDHVTRQRFFLYPNELIGRTIHWRSFGYNTVDAPRHARFYGFREDE